MEKIIWKNEKRKISELKQFEGNPRQANEKETEDLNKSLDRFNLAEPLVINTTGEVIGGNFRLRLLQQKRIEQADVRVPDRELTREEAKELNLRLNKNQGSWQLDLLANFSEDLLKDIGWNSSELDEIFSLETTDDFDLEKEFQKAVKEPKGLKTGDLWQLGEHKLLIGDCTKKENWEKLLGDERFDFLFTDPPYLIGANLGNTKIGSHDYKFKIKTKGGFGYKGLREYRGLKERGGVPSYDSWLSIANEFQNPEGANVMVFECWRNTVRLWQAIERYWKIKNQIIWWLPNRSQGFSAPHKFFSKYDICPLAGEGVLNEEYEEELDDYLKQKGQKLLDSYEIILYANQGKSHWDKQKGSRWARINDHITWTAETGKSSGQSLIFGTKPLQVLTPFVKILSPRNGIVVDPFCGSASTLISCQIMKRRCRTIEVEPLYGEIAISRFERFSGQTALKLAN